MDNSIYVALSNQMGQFRQMDVTAQNIANANTTGFQAENMMFTSYLVDIEQDDDLAYSQDIATYRSTTSGRYEQTDNPLDVAIEGDAYFSVEAPAGVRYTKAGNFHINDQGELVSQQGYPVLDAGGAAIVLEPTDSALLVGDNGLVTVLGLDRSSPREERGTIGMFEFANPQNMTRTGGTMLETEEAPVLSTTSRMVQGTLEQSNVNSISELVRLTKLQRSVGSSSKFIEVAYDLQRKMINTYTQNQ